MNVTVDPARPRVNAVPDVGRPPQMGRSPLSSLVHKDTLKCEAAEHRP